MVFYYTSNVSSTPYKIYVGRDKVENDVLIRWGWPEDIWFHVDKLSSAHIYLRLPRGHTIESIPEEGCKENNVPVVYTMWSNLKKSGDMDVGQVGFHDHGKVKRIIVEKKQNEVINRLEKTKSDDMSPDFQTEREERDETIRIEAKAAVKQRERLEKEVRKQEKLEKERRSYDRVFKEEHMVSNQDGGNESDDFM